MMKSPRRNNPNRLLDTVLAKLELKNDAALSLALGVTPPLLSKVRHGRSPVSAELMIRVHDATMLSIAEIRSLMRDSTRQNELQPERGACTFVGSKVCIKDAVTAPGAIYQITDETNSPSFHQGVPGGSEGKHA